MNDRDRVSETENGCDCTKQSHSVWGSSKILKEIHCVSSVWALTEIKLCPETFFFYSSTRSETILPVAQSRLSLHRSLCVCKNRSHRLNPRWLQKTLQLSFILDMKFPKWLKSGNAYNLISFSSNGYDEGLYTY